MKKGLLAIAGLLVLGTSVEVFAKEIQVGGQVRPRMEYLNPSGGGYDVWTSMRVRAQVKAVLDKDVDVFVQVQDVRIWGEETNTLNDYRADNFDLHQGYVTLNKIRGSGVSIRVGRQEISLGGQRLVGAVDWTQQARSMDGVRATLSPAWGSVDVLGIRLLDTSAAGIGSNAYFGGVYATAKASGGTLDGYGLYNRASGGAKTNQYTLGARWVGKARSVVYRIEGAYQLGKRGGSDVSAFLFGGRAGIPIGKSTVTLWYDYLSGDDNATDGKVKVFDTLFATNHKFYGYADVFLNIPVHTGNLGLQDVALKFSIPLREGVKLDVDGHAFFLAKKGRASGKHLGEEVDVTLSYKYSNEVMVVCGASYVAAKQALADIGRLKKDLKFAYAMMNVAF